MVENLLGYRPHEIVGKKYFFDLFKENNREKLKKLALAIFKQKKSFHKFNNLNSSKNGEDVWISSSGIPILDKNNNLIGYRGANIDITKSVKHKQELLEAKEKAEESDRLKTEFLNNMSHEIRTPMNGILGFSDMLSTPDISDDKRNNFIKIIQSSGNQLLQIIDDILEISRLGTKQVKVIEEHVCLNDLLLELFSIFDVKAKEEKNPLYLKKGLSDRQSTIQIDKTKLTKILSNLLENVLKFTNEGYIEYGYQLINSELEIYVKDTGIGIEPEYHTVIFERFSQAEKDLSKKVGGLGLGLAIVKENTKLLGGKIRLESKNDAGSTFFITIPYIPVYQDDNIEMKKKVLIIKINTPF
ncbi:MAG: hypothetical protein COC16_01540 [Lutibacter sp.]|nr:MAG: hypothetical protein COC16_01540 [Lutibacter sp.]